ncbi:hypothetical protein [Qipengyuania sp. NPDC077563]|uniref:hypothetical protein n=1 Tax=Qipengyuania sp. NPDC077563 TaxID=3364497 RepID=UPI00384A9C01
MMKSVFNMIAVLGACGLMACGEVRLETPAFFEKKTGLPLCSSARIENQTVGEYDFETDFTYSVNITMDQRCEDQLIAEISSRLGISCASLDYCNFLDEQNWSYTIGRVRDNQINFTLRAI